MEKRRASLSERAHFERIAAASGALPEDAPPRSLHEVFERLAALRRGLGDAARPGIAGTDESELEGHLRMLRRRREVGRRGAKRTRGAR